MKLHRRLVKPFEAVAKALAKNHENCKVAANAAEQNQAPVVFSAAPPLAPVHSGSNLTNNPAEPHPHAPELVTPDEQARYDDRNAYRNRPRGSGK